MLRIMHIEEIETSLLRLPDLIAQQERRSPEFVANARAWLQALENALTSSRLYQAASIATLRSGLVAAEQGQVPAGIEFRGRPTRSRTLVALTSQALQRAADVASTVIAENRPRLAEAERVAQQIVAAAVSRGLVPDHRRAIDNTQFLRALRQRLAESTDLENAEVHLEGLVGPHDALVLLDRALSPHLQVTRPAALPPARKGRQPTQEA